MIWATSIVITELSKQTYSPYHVKRNNGHGLKLGWDKLIETTNNSNHVLIHLVMYINDWFVVKKNNEIDIKWCVKPWFIGLSCLIYLLTD